MTFSSILRAVVCALPLALAGIKASWACTAPPPTALQPVDTLLKRTKTVVVGRVKAVRVVGQKRFYDVEVVERLKGTSPTSIVFELPMLPGDSIAKLRSRFGNAIPPRYHESAEFWLGTKAAGAITPSCGVTFDPRQGLHMIFLDKPYHTKGFEPIANDDDWYVAVRSMIANSNLAGRVVSPAEFAQMFNSVYRFTCGMQGRKREHFREPDLIAGAPFDFRALNPIFSFRPGPDYCQDDVDVAYADFWSFFLNQHDDRPLAISIVGGRLRFAKQYGDLVLNQTAIDARSLAATLRTKIR